jgi:hypothetical protein
VSLTWISANVSGAVDDGAFSGSHLVNDAPVNRVAVGPSGARHLQHSLQRHLRRLGRDRMGRESRRRPINLRGDTAIAKPEADD